jgi:hypothetical protein
VESQLSKLVAEVSALTSTLDASPSPMPREQERLKVDEPAPAPAPPAKKPRKAAAKK